jgi:peptide/nickel transport system permease protein
VAFLAVLVIVAALATVIAPYSPDAVSLSGSLASPSAQHLLGTDGSGRDILSRLIVGTRTSLGGPALVVGLSALVGVPLGMIGGYVRGVVDGVLARIWDVMLGFPALLLAILLVAVLGKGFWTATLAVALTYVPFVARIVRGMTLAEREKPYIAALHMQGLSPREVLLHHVIRNIGPGVTSQLTVNFGYALLDLTALSFIGLGVQPPTPDWGSMLADAQSNLLISANPVIWPSIAVVATVLAVNIVGEGISARATGERR